MRLNRYLSACGLGSRRGCETLIEQGFVSVNGEICVNLATAVSESDEVVVHGKKVKPHKGVVIVLHKPKGFVCSRRDERDRETLYALLPEKFATLHHVGRLDKESEGLILLTNKGELSNQLMHPSKGVEKEYEVVIESRFNPDDLAKLIKGFHFTAGHAKAERAWMIGDYKIGIVLKQGLKRQIREMLYVMGYEVRRLIRVRIGNLSIKGLPEGAWKELSEKDVDTLLLNPTAKDRPKLSKPRTASVKRHAAKRTAREASSSSKSKSGGRSEGGRDKDKPSSAAKKRRPARDREFDRDIESESRPRNRRSDSSSGGYTPRGASQERRSRKSR